jgi:hypothetical protein
MTVFDKLDKLQWDSLKGLSSEMDFAESNKKVVSTSMSFLTGEAPRFSAKIALFLSSERPFKCLYHLVRAFKTDKNTV